MCVTFFYTWYKGRLGSILKIKETLPDSKLFKAALSVTVMEVMELQFFKFNSI